MSLCRKGRAQSRDDAGFSLVEVIVALGLLGGVLLSIAGLFALANQQLDAGRNHTVALSVARDILEEMDGWGYHQLYETFGYDGSAASYTVDSSSSHAATVDWQELLESEMGNCRAEIKVESVVDSGSPPPLRDSVSIRVEVAVYWKEGKRERMVMLSTVRV